MMGLALVALMVGATFALTSAYPLWLTIVLLPVVASIAVVIIVLIRYARR